MNETNRPTIGFIGLGLMGAAMAERLQTLVFVLSDLDLGMNNWISEPFEYPEGAMDRGKVLSKEDLEALGGMLLTWNNLAFAPPYLLIRNSEEAACYRLPLANETSGSDL